MLDEEIYQLDGLEELNSLSDEITTQMENIIPVETEDPIDPNEPTSYNHDIQDLGPEVTNGISFKSGACVCSCDISCTVGY